LGGGGRACVDEFITPVNNYLRTDRPLKAKHWPQETSVTGAGLQSPKHGAENSEQKLMAVWLTCFSQCPAPALYDVGYCIHNPTRAGVVCHAVVWSRFFQRIISP